MLFPNALWLGVCVVTETGFDDVFRVFGTFIKDSNGNIEDRPEAIPGP